MPIITLIRHGHAGSRNTRGDFDRPLSERGISDTIRMAAVIRGHQVTPDLVLSSPALRAKGTALALAKTWGLAESAVRFERALYEGGPEVYLSLLEEASARYESVALVGHNPVIAVAVELFSPGLTSRFPTCGAAAFRVMPSQGDILSRPKELLFFEFPGSE